MVATSDHRTSEVHPVFDILPVALPALVVIMIAVVLVRREHVVRSPSFDDFDVQIVSVRGSDWKPSRAPRTFDRDGALVMPDDCTLGGRIRSVSPPSAPRARRRQLVAARADR